MIFIGICVIIGSLIIAHAIKQIKFDKGYTVSSTNNTSTFNPIEIIKKKEVIDEFLETNFKQ